LIGRTISFLLRPELETCTTVIVLHIDRKTPWSSESGHFTQIVWKLYKMKQNEVSFFELDMVNE